MSSRCIFIPIMCRMLCWEWSMPSAPEFIHMPTHARTHTCAHTRARLYICGGTHQIKSHGFQVLTTHIACGNCAKTHPDRLHPGGQAQRPNQSIAVRQPEQDPPALRRPTHPYHTDQQHQRDHSKFDILSLTSDSHHGQPNLEGHTSFDA